MPDDFVVFTLQGVDWTLSRVWFTRHMIKASRSRDG
jgi:hypothetical protein